MKLTAHRDILLAPLSVAAEATSKRDTILSHTLTRLAGDILLVQGQDGELAVTAGATVIGEDDGDCLVPPTLLAVLRMAPAGDVVVRKEGSNLHVTTAGGGDYRLPTADVDDYPEVEQPEGNPAIEVAAGDLSISLDRTLFAAAREDGRFALRGILLDTTDQKLTLVATDSHRMSVSQVPAIFRESKCRSALVPSRALQLVGKLIDDPAEAVGIRVTAVSATVTTRAGTVWTRLVEGAFPPWREAIPKKDKIVVPVEAGTFLAAVRQAAVVVDQETKRVDLTFAPNTLTLKARGAATGAADVAMSLRYAGSPLSIAFDPAYLTEYLRVVPASTSLSLGMQAGDKSAVFREDGHLHLLVPLV